MATATDEQFFFAIIKQLDGHINWQKVADECNIVSKGAANKRFSRMKVKYENAGNGDNATTAADTGTPAADGETKTTKKKPATKKASSKKRKLEVIQDDAEEDARSTTVKQEDEEDEASHAPVPVPPNMHILIILQA